MRSSPDASMRLAAADASQAASVYRVSSTSVATAPILVTFSTTPVFQRALDYEIAPDGTVDLINQRIVTASSGCLVSSVNAE